MKLRHKIWTEVRFMLLKLLADGRQVIMNVEFEEPIHLTIKDWAVIYNCRFHEHEQKNNSSKRTTIEREGPKRHYH